MNPYRQPGAQDERPEPPDQFAIIEEAWRICKDRQAALIGAEPPWWRFIARALWAERCDRFAYMTPSKMDLVAAGACLRAKSADVVALMASHTEAHR